MKIFLFMKETPGDLRFYERWSEIGELVKDPQEADCWVVDQHTHLTSVPSHVKYVVSPTTGHTHLNFTGPKIISLRGETDFLCTVRSVSEFTIGLMLRFARPAGIGSVLHNKKLGIIGFGRIGHQVAVLASAFGMRVYGIDVKSESYLWDSAFKNCDFISIHLSENPSSRGIVNSRLLGLMKPTAYFINTARASVVDEDALYNVLSDRRIAGAALDVTDKDWTGVPNVTVTGHTAGFTLEDRIRTDEFICDKLRNELGPRRVREGDSRR